jgi:hypothetical protein
MTPAARAALGYALGVLTACAGVLLVAGLGVALIVAGVITAASFLLLADTDRKDRA